MTKALLDPLGKFYTRLGELALKIRIFFSPQLQYNEYLYGEPLPAIYTEGEKLVFAACNVFDPRELLPPGWYLTLNPLKHLGRNVVRYCWRWWNGSDWSIGIHEPENTDPELAGNMARLRAPSDVVVKIAYNAYYWPPNARVEDPRYTDTDFTHVDH